VGGRSVAFAVAATGCLDGSAHTSRRQSKASRPRSARLSGCRSMLFARARHSNSRQRSPDSDRPECALTCSHACRYLDGPPPHHRPLSTDTWPAFSELVARHNGVFGGCWCTWFHTLSRDKDRTYETNRDLKCRLVEERRAHAALFFDGDEAMAWAEYGPPEELPNIHHRQEYEAGLVRPPDYRITCIFVDRRYRRRGSRRWPYEEPSTSSPRPAAAWSRATRTTCRSSRRGRRCHPPSSTTAPADVPGGRLHLRAAQGTEELCDDPDNRTRLTASLAQRRRDGLRRPQPPEPGAPSTTQWLAQPVQCRPRVRSGPSPRGCVIPPTAAGSTSALADDRLAANPTGGRQKFSRDFRRSAPVGVR